MATKRQKMLAGEMYDPFDPEMVAARTRALDLWQHLNATRESDEAERRRTLRDLFGKGGDTVDAIFAAGNPCRVIRAITE
ncbi:MAG: hypothetical protein DMF98_16015 [Acidobacteria bacterium]|nr:MAG: hypothetical protein DMF98_16015 [Acidobacteriota bacterium]